MVISDPSPGATWRGGGDAVRRHETAVVLRFACFSRKRGSTSVPKISICSSRIFARRRHRLAHHDLLETREVLLELEQTLDHQLRRTEDPILVARRRQPALAAVAGFATISTCSGVIGRTKPSGANIFWYSAISGPAAS